MTSVLIATQHLTATGGVGVHVLRAAAALREAGRTVRVVAGRIDVEAAGDDVHELPGLEARRVPRRAMEGLERAARDLPGPVVAHLHHAWDPRLVERLRPFGPVVWNIHEFAACPTGNYYSMPGRYRRTAEHVSIMKASDRVVAYSHFVARHVRRNGIQHVRVAPLIVPSVPGWTAPPAEKRVLFAGRIAPNKGLQTLFAAARRLDVTVDVAGSGWWQPEAERLAAKLGLGDRATFHGWQPPDAVDELYRRATVAVVPSLWPEPFGMVGPEAMAHGRPVVASDTGGIPEWLDHGRTGYLVRTGDDGALAGALETVLADPALARRMGEAGAAQVRERFSPKAHVAALDELHAELL